MNAGDGMLGAVWDGSGVRFRLRSQHASALRLCLFESRDSSLESERIEFARIEPDLWEAYVEGAEPGLRYGVRADGPWNPAEGHRFNPAKLLIDPYARAIDGPLRWHGSLVGGTAGGGPDPRDSAPWLPRSVVVDESFDWAGDRRPQRPWADTVIYECHVKGTTAAHPQVDRALRGTFLGLASEPMIEHLLALGVTAVELMPVQQTFHDRALCERGLSNYWGYSPIAYFAPDERLATGGDGRQVVEFKEMVRTLHRAGIEVLLDVVLNHTGEGGEEGPHICLRGLDNAVYYRLDPTDRRRYLDFSGCGNSLDVRQPAAVTFVLDVLRYWVEAMHVDGFRLDLAASLMRTDGGLDPSGGVIGAISRDPLLSRVKWIAEPWDLGEDGYALGRFGDPWREWNDRYRHALRRYWRGDAGMIGEVATRVAGSSDVFGDRSATAGVNYLASHDGFTLYDTVSYERKHNDANGEGGRDGEEDNASANWGVEGVTDDPRIRRTRFRVLRSMIASLAVSRGVPMLRHGDEIANTQMGNNNAYCQDNPVSWLDWRIDGDRRRLLEFTRRVFALRRRFPMLRGEQFYRGARAGEESPPDLLWLRPDGREMTEADWADESVRALAMRLAAHTESVLIAFNAGTSPVWFELPSSPAGWNEVLCSVERRAPAIRRGRLRMPEHSIAILVEGEPR